MAEKNTTDLINSLSEDIRIANKKAENANSRLNLIYDKFDKKFESIEDKLDKKFDMLNDKFDEAILKLNDRASLTDLKYHDQEKKIQVIDIILNNKIKTVETLENKVYDQDQTLNKTLHNFNIKIASEELLQKEKDKKMNKIKIALTVIGTLGGIASLIIPFLG